MSLCLHYSEAAFEQIKYVKRAEDVGLAAVSLLMSVTLPLDADDCKRPLSFYV